MVQRYTASGETIDHTIAGSNGVKGDFRVSGVRVCCLLDSGAIGDIVPAAITGRFRVITDTGAAWAAGARVYLSATANTFTTTAAGGTFAGYAAAAKLSGAATAEIVLAGPGVDT